MAPESLLEEIWRLKETERRALARLGLKTVRDLLYHFPHSYKTLPPKRPVASVQKGDDATFVGTITNLELSKTFRKRVALSEGVLVDGSGKIKIIWFHQPYLARMLRNGLTIRASGRISERKNSLYLANPEIEVLPKGLQVEEVFGGMGPALAEPIYPESRGISSTWMHYAIAKILRSGVPSAIKDRVPEEILKRYSLPSLKTALFWVHAPQKEVDKEAARKRFAFEEVFLIQLSLQKEHARAKENQSFLISKTPKDLEKFTLRFPFKETSAQKKAIEDILRDFGSHGAMGRLLEGDVGSGKTAVAAASAYAAVTTPPASNQYGALQVAYMAPTEILATQHFENFITFFKHLPIEIGLITGSGCRKFPSKVNPNGWTDISRAQLLKWVAEGKIAILLGTHALIQKSVRFKNLAYIIIDEQHRFGVRQRLALARGKNAEQTPNNAEKEEAGPLLYRDLTYRIRQSLFQVKKTLGPGHKESVYQKALAEQLRANDIPFTQEEQIPVIFRGKKVGIYRPDFVVEDKVVLELKALPFTGTQEKKQLWNYLKGSSYRLALLANFSPTELKIDRVIYDSARNSAFVPHSSAFDPRKSASAPQSSASSPRSSASIPHLLSMTATPIPRTLALTIYGDLDLTLLDEMPAGRKPIVTKIIEGRERASAYNQIRKELQTGRQAYVICSRIDEPDREKELALEAKSVKTEAKRLKKEVFPEYEIEVLHGKVKPKEKDEVMKRFSEGKTHILVATSVVEVGVNVQNATAILIEGAERFGLAQLHQLRGRVLRSTHQSYCFLFAEKMSGKTRERLKAFLEAKNGFELAEKDLELRGPGELSGSKQWGLSDIGMEALKNLKMVEAARKEAAELVGKDPDLNDYPLLQKAASEKLSELHLE